MEPKTTLTNYEKIEKVLQSIKKTMNKKEIVERYFDYDMCVLQGKIGNDVTYFGREMRNTGSTLIDLKFKKRALGTLKTNGSSHFDPKQMHRILVISPQWGTAHTTSFIRYLKNKNTTMEVWYEPNTETPDSVIDNLYHSVQRSKLRARLAKKLRKIKLPSMKLRAAEQAPQQSDLDRTR